MYRNQILIILFLISGICSCKKDKVEYPITYSSSSFSDHIIKVYTRDGEVTSPSLVSNVLNHYQYQLKKLDNDKIRGQVVVNYLSEDSVELTIDNIKEDKRRSVHEISGLIYLEKQDTSMYGYGPLFQIEDLYTYSPLYSEEFFAPPGSGYTKYVKFKDCYFIIKKGGKLYIPMFDFVWIFQIPYGNSSYPITGINNSFSEAGVKDFIANDTMIIQQYLIEMK